MPHSISVQSVHSLHSLHSQVSSSISSGSSLSSIHETGLRYGKTSLFSLYFHLKQKTLYTYGSLFMRDCSRQHRYTLICAFVELLQLVSFAFEPVLHYWGPVDIVTDYAQLVHTFGASLVGFHAHVTIFFTGTAVTLMAVAIGYWIHRKLERGEEDVNNKVIALQLFVHSFLPFLYIPLLSYSVDLLACNTHGYLLAFGNTESARCWQPATITFFVLAILAALVFLAIGLATATLYFDWLPHQRAHLSAATPRFNVLLYIVKTLLVLASSFAAVIPSEKARVWAYGITLVASAGALLFWLFFTLPFHKARTNIVYGAALATFLYTALVRLMSAAVGEDSLYGLVVWAIGAPVAALAGLLLLRWRVARLYGRIHSPDLAGGSLSFSQPFEVEIAARSVFFGSESERELGAAVFTRGLDRFPNKAEVHIAYTVFLLANPEEFALISVEHARARKLRLSPDLEFLLYCVDRKRRQITALSDGGAEEIGAKLKLALRYQEESKRRMRAFWLRLLNEDDLTGLPDEVAAIEKNENRAEQIYGKLLARYPKSVRILRAYGLFLEEIKNDMETAQLVYRSADELEEAKSRRHRAKGKDKQKLKRVDSQAQLPAVVISADRPPAAMLNTFLGNATGEGSADLKGVHFNRGDKADTAISENETLNDAKPAREEEGWDAEENASLHSGSTGEITDKAGDQARDPHLNAKGRRAVMFRQRKYRQRIEKSRSLALQKLGLATKITVLVLLADVIAIYATSATVMNTYKESLNLLSIAGKLRKVSHDLAFFARTAERTAIAGQHNATEAARAGLRNGVTFMRATVKELTSGHLPAPVWRFWRDANLPVKRYLPTSYMFDYQNVSAYGLAEQLTESALSVANFLSDADLKSAANNTDFRFLLDNGASTAFIGFDHGVDVYLDYNLHSAHQLRLSLAILLPVSLALLVAMFFALFLPSMKKIKQERNTTLKLFLSIPKSTLAQIVEKNMNKEDEMVDFEEEQAREQDMMAAEMSEATAEIPILRKLLQRYLVSLTVIFMIASAMFAIGLYFVQHDSSIGPEVNVFGLRRALSARINFLANEFWVDDRQTWPQGREALAPLLLATVERLRINNDGLRFGNNSLGLPGVFANDELKTLDGDTPCQFLNQSVCPNDTCGGTFQGSSCSGLQSLIDRYLRDATDLAHASAEVLSSKSQPMELTEIKFLYPKQLITFLQIAMDIYTNSTHDKIVVISACLSAIFAVSFPVILIAYASLRPLERRIKEENARTMKMLLMIPMEVIDSVTAIKEYLEGGESVSSEKKMQGVLEETAARNRTVMEAAVDAIVTINANCMIEVFNPAAERLFGYSAIEVLGKNVSMLMTDDTARQHDGYVKQYLDTGKSAIIGTGREVIGRHKNGSTMPLHLSLAEGKVHGKTIFASFLRNITELKMYRDRSEKLLQSLLPVHVADQLKHSGLDDLTNRPLIAESYKEVTILFADIVGFTKMTSGITPSELIHMLSTLFSAWDRLCEKHHVEKIKTIGDCYMAAGGVPVRSMDHAVNVIEFALDMQATLEEFNRSTSNHLQLRIGINTGSVVAGVIGTKKINYDLWGDAVNVASRMESTGIPGKIQVSQSTFELTHQHYLYEERGRLKVKGKGDMLTYVLQDRRFFKTLSGHIGERPTLAPPTDITGKLESQAEPQQAEGEDEAAEEPQPSPALSTESTADSLTRIRAGSTDSASVVGLGAAGPSSLQWPPSSLSPALPGHVSTQHPVHFNREYELIEHEGNQQAPAHTHTPSQSLAGISPPLSSATSDSAASDKTSLSSRTARKKGERGAFTAISRKGKTAARHDSNNNNDRQTRK